MKSTNDNLASFMAEMHKQDARRRRMHLSMALSLFPLGIFFLTYGAESNPAVGLLGFGFLLAIAYMVITAHLYGKIDYAEPVNAYLARASERYKFWTIRRAIFALPVLLVMGFAGGWIVWITALKYFTSWGRVAALATYGCFFFGLCLFALIIEWKKWQKEGAPVLQSIINRRKQLGTS